MKYERESPISFHLKKKEKDKEESEPDEQKEAKKKKKKKRARVVAGIEKDLEMGEERGTEVEGASRSNSDSRRCV